VVAGGRDGLRLFAQYAYAPNELGYCGPEDHQALFEYATTGRTDRSIPQLLRGFYGPLPYLRLLAEAAGTGDVFDPRVVEAYWVGNDLLDVVDLADHADTLAGWFRPGVGGSIGLLADTIAAGSRPHHGFHVFQVYPWVGVLERGHVEEPVRQLDGCRIRWGRVVDLGGDVAVVSNQRLVHRDGALELGPPVEERVTRAVHGAGLAEDLSVGDLVSLHWTWICDRIDQGRADELRTRTRDEVARVNARLAAATPR
jgi:hypothetical protein